MEQYRRLRSLARRHNAQFLYETNVGAGLPIINTLRSMVTTGDRIHRIEGILSGTLSFLFNTYDGSVPFSKLLSDARDMGYTEPDPRDDLSGMDVGRKILILGREAEQDLHFDDISIQSMVPEDCVDIENVSEFLEKLKSHDEEFAHLLEEAKAKGEKLRFMATLENGKAKVGLNSLDSTHPFYTLKGSDNMILFTTERYHDFPMIIRGPGAGADVTAAGVFADVIRIGNFSR
jgi:aspartokinase/homoserine dehydrogenase 1